MSDLLTHWAIFEDTCRYVLADDAVCAEIRSAAHDEREYARLGAISRYGNWFVPEIMAKARTDWAAPDADRTRILRRLAFALGGVTHFPTDYFMKPLLRTMGGSDWNAMHAADQAGKPQTAAEKEKLREVSAYYDVKVFNEVYRGGTEEPFSPMVMSANSTDAGKALEEFVRALFQRALLACHTFSPPQRNVEPWLDAIIDQVQPLYIAIERYSKVFYEPDQAKMESYGVETVFYRADDPSVALARKLQAGYKPAPAEITDAIKDGANKGGYGKALALSAMQLRECSDFWQGKTDSLPNIYQGG
jgi:hypothetical protein